MKKILAIVLALSMMLSIPAFADTTTTTQTSATEATTTLTTTTLVQNAGITPDSALYALDKLIEKIQIAIITDAVKEADLIANIAQERLAESEAMADKANVELAQKALEEYQVDLEKAVAMIETAMEDGKEVSGVMKSINDANLEDAVVVAKILTSIPEEFRAEVKAGIEVLVKATEAANETAQVIENKEEENGIKQDITNKIIEEKVKDAALIAKINEAGLSTRQVIALISLSEQSKKPLAEVIDLFLQNEKGIGATAHELGLTTKDALKGINTSFKITKETIKDAFKEAIKVVETEDQTEVLSLVNKSLDGQTEEIAKTTKEAKAVTEKLEKVVKEAKEQVKAIVAEKKEDKVLDKAQKEIEKVEKAAEKAIEKVEKAAEKDAVKDTDKAKEVQDKTNENAKNENTEKSTKKN
jgi:hypothetical protein